MKSAPAPAGSIAPTQSDNQPGDLTRNIVSLLLIIHIFCVAVALWGNVQRSGIESRLLHVLSPYLRPLNLDPDFTRFHLVHGADNDDDRFFEVEIDAQNANESDDKSIIVLPEGGSRAGLARRRYFALSYVMGFYANPDTENDATTAEIAKSIGGAVLREENAERAIVRCRQMLSQPRDLDFLEARFPKDPLAPEYATVVYEADVWIDDVGQVQVNPRISALETAGVEANATGAKASVASDETTDPSPGRPAAPRSGVAAPKSDTGAKPPPFDPRSERYPFRPQPGRAPPSRAPSSDSKTP